MEGGNCGDVEVVVSEFEYSVDKFFDISDRISEICGEKDREKVLDPDELQRFSSMTTFVEEWKCFNYEPKTVSLAYESEYPGASNTVITGIHLPPFSSTSVPRVGCAQINEASDVKYQTPNCKDFILHTGGSIWALDWCPRAVERADSRSRCEYLAVSVHPPGSSYHHMGLPLSGRGIVQIWCIQHSKEEAEPQLGYNYEMNFSAKKAKGRFRKNPFSVATIDNHKEDSVPKKSRGRPKKQQPAIQHSHDLDDECTQTQPKRPRGKLRKQHGSTESSGIAKRQETSNLTVTLSASDFEPDENLPISVWLGTRNTVALENPLAISALQNEMDKALTNETLHGFNADEKCRPSKKGRGRPKRSPDVPKDFRKDLDESAIVHPASDEINRNITKDCVSKIFKYGANGKELPLLPEDVVRSRNQLLSLEKPPVEDKHLLPFRRSKRARKKSSRFSSIDFELRGQEMYEQPSTIEGKFSSSTPCVTNSNNEPVENSKLNVLENFSIAKPLPPSSTEFGKDANTKIFDKMLGLTVPVCEEANLQNFATGSSDNPTFESHDQDDILQGGYEKPLATCYPGSDYHKDVALPRLVLCLAHMGTVAWDVKWRPCTGNEFEKRRYMGYLAAALGNGSLEVWEVPLLYKVKILYTSCSNEGQDPRFISLRPVFRCSILKRGDRQSIPLTVEWSPSSPDLILAGCHDGTVALWKFSVEDPCPDSRPLLCFLADNVPIRAVAWAPQESDTESANLIVTAGDEKLKFWDIRDPYCPLYDFNPVQRHVLSVDWLKNPRCVILSLDDGTIRILSLSKALSDVCESGKPSNGTKPGHHYYFCSSFAIWSIHVSSVTGQVAYCGADGSANRFQVTVESVGKDSSRYRQPHFMCGSLVDDSHNLCMNIPLTNVSVDGTPGNVQCLQSEANYLKIADPNTAGDALAIVPASGSSQQNESNNTSLMLKNINREKDVRTRTAIVCTNKGKGKVNVQNGVSHAKSEKLKENFPSKRVAMHKVRWNMNHGSERWLCYGGAAGILRCQEIALADL